MNSADHLYIVEKKITKVKKELLNLENLINNISNDKGTLNKKIKKLETHMCLHTQSCNYLNNMINSLKNKNVNLKNELNIQQNELTNIR